MKNIGGNKIIELQIKSTIENEIGEQVEIWETVDTLKGFLDLSNGDSKYNNYNTKIQESTHLFIGDYKILDSRIKSENLRVFEPKTQKYYDVMLLDNPMELNEHWEIYLKYTGGQIAKN